METSVKVGDDSVKVSACEPPVESNGKGRCRDPVNKCKIAEITLLCVVMVVIWVSLALPVLFFYLPLVSDCMLHASTCEGTLSVLYQPIN